MGQKTNPKILRIPLLKPWQSQWFASGKRYRDFLEQDIKIRDYLNKKLKNFSVDSISIERSSNSLRIIINTARPGLIIGRGGTDIEKLKKELKEKFLDKKISLELNVKEVQKPSLSASIVMENIIDGLEKRIPYRRVMKRAISQVQKSGALGVRVALKGRLDGVEIARKESLSWGRMPSHTFRADIDYARGAALTTYGKIGVKVWIYRGEVFQKENKK